MWNDSNLQTELYDLNLWSWYKYMYLRYSVHELNPKIVYKEVNNFWDRVQNIILRRNRDFFCIISQKEVIPFRLKVNKKFADFWKDGKGLHVYIPQCEHKWKIQFTTQSSTSVVVNTTVNKVYLNYKYININNFIN